MIDNNTIVAQSTPYGRSGVGIIKISGPQVQIIALKILGKLPKPRYALYCSFLDMLGSAIDEGIALWFPKPYSFTGEDVLELHGHGNPVILDLLIKSILSIKNVRIAHPGEFSERAFLNNKIDLIQAESIMQLISANSELGVKSSLRSLQGVFSKKINYLINIVIKIRSIIEILINFPEEDIDIHCHDIDREFNRILKVLGVVINTAKLGHILYDGIKVVLVGESNVGKSSLFNKLLLNNSAIVTDIPGTTRDVLNENIYIDGMCFTLTDTAGLRETNNIIEKIGIQKMWEQVHLADHILLIIDDSLSHDYKERIIHQYINKFPLKSRITVVFNKIDISGSKIEINKDSRNINYITISALTGAGVKMLIQHLKESAIGKIDCYSEPVFLARNRHVNILNKVLNNLNHAKKSWDRSKNIEFLSEDFKIIQDLLNNITGRVTTENILDNIFSSFCIGK